MSKYIVGFKKDLSSEEQAKQIDDLKANGAQVHNHFDSIKAVSVTLENDAFEKLNSSLTGDSAIRYIEPDGPVSIQPIAKN